MAFSFEKLIPQPQEMILGALSGLSALLPEARRVIDKAIEDPNLIPFHSPVYSRSNSFISSQKWSAMKGFFWRGCFTGAAVSIIIIPCLLAEDYDVKKKSSSASFFYDWGIKGVIETVSAGIGAAFIHHRGYAFHSSAAIGGVLLSVNLSLVANLLV